MMKEIKNILIKALSGMVWGLFATLLTGTIITQIASLCGYKALEDNATILVIIYGIGTMLKSLMGLGIGVGIALACGFSGLKCVCIALAGAVATTFTNNFKLEVVFKNGFFSGGNNDPVIVYLVVVIVAILINLIWKKKTPFDLILQPLFCVAVAIISTWLLSPIVTFLLSKIGALFSWMMNGTNGDAPMYQKLIFSSVISLLMGMLLTAPISSAAIAISINLTGLGAGAAVIGCCCQMVGFAIMSLRDNKVGIFFASLFGTSMIFFPNILKKPLIWLPTMISSIILAPLATYLFSISSSSVGAGMGTCGLVGVLQTLEFMEYSTSSWLAIGLIAILGSATLTFLIDLLFRKLNWIKKGDLTIAY